MRKTLHLICSMLVLTMFMSCSEVELCDSQNHPHSASVKFRYDMSNLGNADASRIDSMSIIAYRIVGQWKSLITIAPNGTGNFIDVYGNATPTEEGEEVDPGQPMAENSDVFKVKPGDYKFITFTMDTTEIENQDIYEYIKAPAKDMLLSDVCVSYRTLALNDPKLKNPLRGWDDYNQYANYVQTEPRPLIYDLASLVTVEQGKTTTVDLRPHTKMQRVTVDFDIEKKVDSVPFTVDSVWMEISGIPIRLNLTNHHLDISRTAKAMAKMTLNNSNGSRSDTDTNTHLNCQASLNVNGIIAPTDSEEGANDAAHRTSGPGLLQVIIFTHSNEISAITGKPKRKRFQGMINLYNTLKRSPSVKLTEDGQFAEPNGEECLIRITDSILLDGENIKSYSNEDGGITDWDQWKPTSKTDLIIEV